MKGSPTLLQFPEKPGKYCIWSWGCMSLVPEYRLFTGTEWTFEDGDSVDTIHYSALMYLPGSWEPLPEPEEKMDLQSRLERYKLTKGTK